MEYFEIRDLTQQLQTLRAFFFEIAAKQESLSVIGLRRVNQLGSYEVGMAALSRVEERLADCQRTAGFIDRVIAGQIQSILTETPLMSMPAELKVSLEIEKAQTAFFAPAGIVRTACLRLVAPLGIKLHRKMFEDGGILPVKRMLTDIDRLTPLLEKLEHMYFLRTHGADDIFKPSNLDKEKVSLLVDRAIILVSEDTRIDRTVRIDIENYLIEARAELAKDTPRWKDVVGALVIVSTILSGLAVAPDAYDVVNSAVKYILGTSVEPPKTPKSELPKFLPPSIEV